MRIVSLAPSTTDVLIHLGFREEIAGITEQCADVLAISDKVTIGSFVNPNVEKIIATNPDLIITAGKIHGRFHEEFEKQGIKVLDFGARSFADIYNDMEELGRISRRKEIGQQVSTLRERIEAIRRKIPKSTAPPRVIRLFGIELPRLYSIAPGVYQYEAIQVAGGKPMTWETEEYVAQLTLEAVISFDPEVIISCGHRRNEAPILICKGCTVPAPACQRDITDIYDWEGWQGVSAIRNRRVHSISCATICRPGHRLADLVEVLAKIFYPDSFE